MEISFTHPIYLWLLMALPFLFLIHFFSLRYVRKRGISIANFEALKRVTGGNIISWNIPLLVIRTLTLIFLIFSAAGFTVWLKGISSDYNYVLAIDASGSMLADDFSPNRFEAAKQAALLFVDNLKANAQIGVVSFSGIAFIEQRLTDSKSQAKDAIENIKIKSMHGTAIGEALKTSENMLLSDEKSRMIILMTDGRENVASSEEFNKLLTDLKNEQIVVHTIGVGTDKGGNLPGLDALSTLDKPFLMNISNATSGQFFIADSNQALTNAYTALATTTQTLIPYKLQFPLITIAFILLFSEWALINTKYRSAP
jgi:Ca-activated chloride channel family protein